ncbi:MAG: serine/threonine protein kinase [Deltaproteobacteria bacterium]|nr:serine/threonine protein kinase [Deltaproteobacteria bacterium]
MSLTLSCPQCGRRFAEPADRCSVDGSPLYGPEVLARVGAKLGNYDIQGILGEGGMGVVYRGEHSLLGKPVAIKVLHERFARRKGAADQFLKEARAASRIRHPSIVDVTDFGTSPDGSVYFIMEYLEGESLETILARQGVVPIFKAVNIVRQIGHALAAAHDHGIVHQDLKPDNIFLTNREGRRRVVRAVQNDTGRQFVVEAEGTFDFVKVLDFGVARMIADKAPSGWSTKTGIIFGTPHYMSPEQARGEAVDGRSDVYALGILFYEMVTGTVPFEGDAALDILNGHVSGKVVPPGERNPRVQVDEGTHRTIMRCLEKKPDRRFQTMDDLVEALADCFTDTVFLRDAHRLPGAVEAGIVPPHVPDRPDELPLPAGASSTGAAAAPPRPASPPSPAVVASRPGAQGGRTPSSRLTDELAELFSATNPSGGSPGALPSASARAVVPNTPASTATPPEREAPPLLPHGTGGITAGRHAVIGTPRSRTGSGRDTDIGIGTLSDEETVEQHPTSPVKKKTPTAPFGTAVDRPPSKK